MSARPLAPALERAGVLGLGLVAVYAALVPLGGTGALPVPDLVFCLAAAWVVRRPARAPLWAVLALGLTADLMLSRPPGLGALGLLLVTERLRAGAAVLHGRFVLEWLAVAAGFVAVLASMHVVLLLVFLDPPPLRVSAGYAASTALAYPVVVALLHLSLRIRGPQSGRGQIRLGRLP